ncbi:MAG: hypothetical protein PHX79_07695, partial [Sphaerochaetaceae bacterium]|nr:hypothetical protein [Sphaerochaetaceae bacterium]
MKAKYAFVMLFITYCLFLSAVPRNLVVVEIATGTWCGYCPGAAMGAHDLINNGHAVAIVKNHNGDPYANTYSNARNSYYGVTGYPSAFFDGLNVTAGGSGTSSMYSNYLPKVNARLAVPSSYTISATGTLSGNQLIVLVNVAKPEATVHSNVVLHSSLTQSNIPQNWFNQSTVDNVNRLMSPNQLGSPINLSTGESTNITLTYNLNPAWNFNLNDLELVLWLQNTNTKEILQGAKYSIQDMLFPQSQNDLAAESIIGPLSPFSGTPTIYMVGVSNLGANPQDDYQVQIIDAQDNVLAWVSGPPIASQDMAQVPVEVTFDITGPLAIKGRVVLNDDEVPENNLTQTLDIDIFQAVYDDLVAIEIYGPLNPTIGEPATYTVSIANRGYNTQDDYLIQIIDNHGNVLATAPGISIGPFIEEPVQLSFTPENYGSLIIRARVILEYDEIPDNNYSEYIELFVTPHGTFTVTIGDGSEQARKPVDMHWKNSLFQTLYFPDELGFLSGHIFGVKFYNNFTTNLPAKPIKIWLGETAQTSLSTYIPSTQLTLVFDGTVDFPAGPNTIDITFTTPYSYTGTNLVMFVHRPMDTEYYSSSDNFLCQTVGSNRSLNHQSDSTTFDPANPPAGPSISGQFPKTTFVYTGELIAHDLGALSISGNTTPSAQSASP